MINNYYDKQGTTDYLGVSGVWIRNGFDNATAFFNPLVLKQPEYSQSPIYSKTIEKKDLFSEDEFVVYAEGLQKAGDEIKLLKPDVVLIPLRGAVRPWSHLQIYCDLDVAASCVFPFTGVQKKSDETKDFILRSLIVHQDKDAVEIVCIDAAEGGFGSRALLDILEELHKAQGETQIWKISLFLFVPEEKEHAAWKHEHEGRSNGETFFVDVKLLPLSKVIGEDIEGAMIEPQNFGKFQEAKFEFDGTIYRIETAELPAVIDQRITYALHDLLRTEPGAVGRSVINVKTESKTAAYKRD